MQLKSSYLPTILLFSIACALLIYFLPREGRFHYKFYEGKPWQHELLTAPNDFPIYKNDELIAAEQDSALLDFRPYYKMDMESIEETIKKLREKYITVWQAEGLDARSIQYVDETLRHIYSQGIIPTEQLQQLNNTGEGEINLLQNNVAVRQQTDQLYTTKSAYQYLIQHTPENVNRGLLVRCDLHLFLSENVAYDEAISERMRSDLIAQIPLIYGVVQAGERIIDRGEIVNERTYDILRSLRKEYETRSVGEDRAVMILVGEAVLIILLVSFLYLYLLMLQPQILNDHRSIMFLLLTLTVPCLITEILVTYYPSVDVYILPYAIMPIVTRVFFDSKTTLWLHTLVIFICSLMVPFPYEFLFLQFVAGIIVSISLNELTQRSQLIRTVVFVFAGYAVTYAALVLHHEGALIKIDAHKILFFGINLILLLFSYVLVYILEKIFGYVSSITLIELSNINSPLLKELSENCPGTFQHSLQVSALASAASEKVGANTQLVRTGALYHDIGKMANPAFFTENQKSVNPHDSLSFEESASIIINHVNDGIKLAEKAGLPVMVIDFIRTHHGRGKAKYFYNSYKNANPNAEIDEEVFTYPGPNPYSKETSILMMADSVEAASRSLKKHTEEDIRNLINNIVDAQISDGLLKESPITFHDVEVIKEVFYHKLTTIFHTRISYPDLKKKDISAHPSNNNSKIEEGATT